MKLVAEHPIHYLDVYEWDDPRHNEIWVGIKDDDGTDYHSRTYALRRDGNGYIDVYKWLNENSTNDTDWIIFSDGILFRNRDLAMICFLAFS